MSELPLVPAANTDPDNAAVARFVAATTAEGPGRADRDLGAGLHHPLPGRRARQGRRGGPGGADGRVAVNGWAELDALDTLLAGLGQRRRGESGSCTT
ncbi:hypothetical protein ACQEVZ_24290 [Dactylosporangium sp. CA-152071]|uniref:hypothetical protein n=1 Tax=Dactylosporangium sp. CA-152071 TaxID=3239933 RepID=UPI003D8C0DDD